MASRTARHRRWLAGVILMGALVAGCVPASIAETLAGPVAQEVERVAQEAFHRMALGRLQVGSYTTNVLVDVALPRGARITVESFGGDDYCLRVDSNALDVVHWLVSPRGVRRVIQR